MRAAAARRSEEKSFQASVVEAARLLGWRVYHTFDSRRSEAGFPDLVLVRRGRLVLAELKGDFARLRPSQLEWLRELQKVAENTGAGGAVSVYSWRPSDWEEISDCLR